MAASLGRGMVRVLGYPCIEAALVMDVKRYSSGTLILGNSHKEQHGDHDELQGLFLCSKGGESYPLCHDGVLR